MVHEIVERALAQGVHLFVKDGCLGFKVKKGCAFSDALKLQVRENKTALMAYLSDHQDNTDSKQLVPRPVAQTFPLSAAQRRLWFVDQLGNGSPQYNMYQLFKVGGSFDITAAEGAFSQIVERHEALRTVYLSQDGEGVQRINPARPFNIEYVDLSHLPLSMQKQESVSLIAQCSNSVFDLSKDLMMHVLFINVSPLDGVNQGWLLINTHHIASDGWSNDILLREFSLLYQAALVGQTAELKPLDIQYADYAYSSNKWAQSHWFKGQVEYWQKQLRDVPALHSLPLDKPRGSSGERLGAEQQSTLSLQTSLQLQAQAKYHRLTPFMLIHGALALVLSRHANSHDIVVGTAIANRNLTALESVIGFFVNMLTLRVNTNHEHFSDYLAHVKSVNLDALANQDVPFDTVVDSCKAQRSSRNSPLFQILFTMDTIGDELVEIPGIDMTEVKGDQKGVKFDLEVSAQITDEGIDFIWLYDSALFTEQRIAQLSLHFNQLLSAIAQNPDVPMAQLEILSDCEIAELADSFYAPSTAKQEVQYVHQLFERQVAEHSEKTALVQGQKKLGYDQLNKSANRLAQLLQQKGIRPDDLVGICLNRSFDAIVAVLAVLKAGGAYLPLDTGYPRKRIKYMLEDAQVSVVLTSSVIKAELGFSDELSMLCLDDTDTQNKLQTLGTDNLHWPKLESQAHCAYVIYTSGSTGRPKGVMVSHRNWLSYIDAIEQLYLCDHDRRVLQFATMSFDIFIEELSLTLLSGGTLVLPEQPGVMTCEDFWHLVDTQDIAVASLPMAYWHQLCMDPQLAEQAKQTPLRLMITGGEAMAANQLGQWQRNVSAEVKLFNTYGPTEATVIATAYDCAEHANEDTSVSIGKAIGNSFIMLLDEQLRLVPKGAVGEIYIAGECVAIGYLHRADLTAERFIDNPYGNSGCGRLYRTGDLARLGFDGNIEFVGRVDNQVKIRGLRIELGEVEHQIAAHSSVNSCVIVVTDSQMLVAYLIKQDKQLSDEKIIAQLKYDLHGNLPEYMIPTSFVCVEQWPLTPNGKVDKDRLPPVDLGLSDNAFDEPLTETEQRLQSIWAQMLNLQAEQLSTTANFFNLGGHSLLAIVLVNKIRQCFDVDVTVKQLLDHATIKTQAELIAHFDHKVDIKGQLLKPLFPKDESLPTLYCIPAAASMSLSFMQLAHSLNGKLNVLAFDYQGLGTNQQIHTQLDEMVDVYLSEIFDNQASGPYYIAGHSFGGMVAYQLVTKLQQRGTDANYIALDCHLFALNDKNTSSQSEEAETLERMVQQYHHLYTDSESLWQHTVNNIKAVFVIQLEMLQSFRAEQVLTTDILHLYSSESFPIMQQTGQFDKLAELTCASVHHSLVAGDHFSMLETSNVATIADKIETFLIGLRKAQK
ncbi:hypothetical protein BTN33_12685 [Aeromonas veronii]|uniref:non-ribosomal peptide synthetase n=1 Tax=Aeromonas veronii TaxID=654 RepID=UPI00094728F6|nr:non-ribosomal peptide synthetase [Aeromonas veronii]OLF58442.1 hypothetical protein BTN33_12685 [Aeromonas veronii]